MRLSKKELSAIKHIKKGNDSMAAMSEIFNGAENATEIVKSLELKNLIIPTYRDGTLDSFILTQSGIKASAPKRKRKSKRI